MNQNGSSINGAFSHGFVPLPGADAGGVLRALSTEVFVIEGCKCDGFFVDTAVAEMIVVELDEVDAEPKAVPVVEEEGGLAFFICGECKVIGGGCSNG